jgi:hypothetical protein
MLGAEMLLFLFILPISIIVILFFSYRYHKKRSIGNKLRIQELEIIQAYEELFILWNRDQYLEHRTINQWLKNWSYLKPIIAKSVNLKISSQELKEKIAKLFSVFNKTEEEVSQRNELFIQKEMEEFKDLFNSVEKYPLTQSQIRPIVTDEYSNLVIAGA